MELCYQWQSHTQSHGARDPNYHWDVDGKKSLIYSQRKCLTRQLKLCVAYNPKVHCTIFRSTHNFLSERCRSSGRSVRGFSSQRSFFLLSAGSLSHKFVEPPRDERAMHPQNRPTPRHSPKIPCSRRIGYNVGAITGVHAKNNSRALHFA